MSASKRMMLLFLSISLLLFLISLSVKRAWAEDTGESLFRDNCSACHPDGGNLLNSKKTLHKADREANNIRTAEDIVQKIRNPGPAPTHPQEWAGMKTFGKDKISDADALKIANYILKTFN
jgi:cytochrome c6